MKRSALDMANVLIRRRSFSKALTVLEGAADLYVDSFDYYMACGIACLYGGEFGNANAYFQNARRIRVMDVQLLLAQAVLFLRRGDTDRAVQYYLDIIDVDPENKIAHRAIDFIRTQGDFETICKWADSGRLVQFYPPLGVNPLTVARLVLSLCAGVVCALVILALHRLHTPPAGGRTDTPDIVLSAEDRLHVLDVDRSDGLFRYNMSEREVLRCFEQARMYAEELDEDKNVHRDNAALVEINRILNSNASDAVKRRADNLRALLFPKSPTFDSLTDNYSYAQVAADPLLYVGCWLVWTGRITNAETEKGAFRCDLLVGYENLKRVEGIVPLFFAEAPVPAIEGDRAVTVLAQLGIENGALVLNGSAVYQGLR